MPKFKHHIFVCTNTREEGHPRGSCNAGGSSELHRTFKIAVAKRGLKTEVRANKAGCLDQCEHGPTVVVYPDEVWYGGVQESDVDEIVDQHIVRGRPVERLRIAESCLNNPECPHRKGSA